MTAAFTPGPWQVWTDEKARRDDVYIAGNPTGAVGGMRHIAYMLATSPDEQIEANARLICAAPDLLAALVALNHMGGDERGGYCICPLNDGSAKDTRHATVCVDARAAIARATGSAS